MLFLCLHWLPWLVHNILLFRRCFLEARNKMTGSEEILMHTLTIYCWKLIGSVRWQGNSLQQWLNWSPSNICLENTHQMPREIAPGSDVLEHCLSRGDASEVPKSGILISCVFLFFLIHGRHFWRQIYLVPSHQLPSQILRYFDVQNHLQIFNMVKL